MQQETEQRTEQQQQQNTDDNMVDRVGETNVYPVSDMDGADEDAPVVPPGELGDREEDDLTEA